MAVTITQSAVKRIRTLKALREQPDHVLRIGVRGGGCSGLSYFVDLVEEIAEKDKTFTFDDITVTCDRKSYLFLNGTEIDFQKSLMKTGFVFNNPLAGTSCSCGDSFAL